jgi:hypothetical protein
MLCLIRCVSFKSKYMSSTRWCSWLRHCATSRKVAGSLPGGVFEIFYRRNFSGHTTVLGSTQPLTEMSRSAQGWQPCHLTCRLPRHSHSLNLLKPYRPEEACNGIVFPDLSLFSRLLPSPPHTYTCTYVIYVYVHISTYTHTHMHINVSTYKCVYM